MPFNKGDFTQQGVAGHVNANLRLNEKRLVNIDLTSNEEAEGCTITGTVTDLLNDEVYPIVSAPSGNIEITENTAEPLDISQYATATVNVSGGGGLPEKILTVTLINPENADVGDIPLIATDFTLPIPEDVTYPYTAYSLYYIGRRIYAEQLEEILCDASVFNTNLFTNLVNCSLMHETSDDNVIWGIAITDPTLRASLTIDVRAFKQAIV